MVALELMQEVLALNKSLQEYTHCERIMSSLLAEVEEMTK